MKKPKVNFERVNGGVNATIGTKEESLWERVRKSAEQQIKDLKEQLIFQEEVLKLAKKKTKGITRMILDSTIGK